MINMYKLVIPTDALNVYVSFTAGIHAVTYKFNEWAYPSLQGSGLFVFQTIEHVVDWVGYIEPGIVWECEVQNPRPLKLMASCLAENDYGLFWANTGYTKLYNAPRGTYIADAVKLVREVKNV